MSSSNNNSTIVFSVDATGVEAGVNKIRTGAATINAAMGQMEQRAQLVDAAMKEAAGNGFELNARAAGKLAAEYQRLSATVGKTQAQILEQKAAANGVTSTFATMGSQIAEASKHTEEMGFKTAGAKRELLVLAHELSQGNFKRFGGSMLVLGERTGAAGLLFSAAGLSALGLAAGIGAAAYEIAKGAEAFNALTQASSATNDYIGLTNGQLKQMAVDLAGTSGSITAASETLALLIRSGQVSGDSLLLAGKAAQAFAEQTGLAADKAAEAMIAFAKDPAKEMKNLQDQYHEFSGTQIEVIEGYIKEGDSARATSEVYGIIASHHKEMTSSVLADMGLIVGSYEGWKIKLADVANWLGNIGKASTQAENYTQAVAGAAEAQANLNKAMALSTGFGGQNVKQAQAQLNAANAQLAVQKKLQDASLASAAADKARATSGDATLRAHSFIDDARYSNPADKQRIELSANAKKFAEDTKDLDKAGALYAEALKKNNDNIDTINKEYARKTKVKSTSPNAGIAAEIASLTASNKLIEQGLATDIAHQKTLHDSGLENMAEYLTAVHTFQEQALADEIKNAQARADVAGGKKELAARNEYLGQVTTLQEKQKTLNATFADDMAKDATKQADAIAGFATKQNNKTMSQQQGYDDTNATQGMTSEDAAKANAKLAITRSYYTTLEQLEAEHNAHQLTLGVYDADKQVAATAYADQLQALQQQQEKQLAVQTDYYTQVKNAMTASTGNSQTSAQLMGSAFTSVYGTMSSTLENFVVNGKGTFSSFAASIISDLAQIALKAAETQIMNTAISMFSTGGSVGGITDAVGGGTRSFATGGSVTGAGTGTSDSIPAMLSNGEYVMTAAATSKYGSLLDSMNSGTMGHFASGGAVGTVAPSSGGGSTHSGNNVFNLSGGGLTQNDMMALAPQFQNMIDKRISQRVMGQGGIADLIKQGKI
jgi:lambda family phage tail tape measure protein